ncbi:MAG: DnaJ domain-containing protein [Ilumatobacteraceae bacterium]
MRGDGGRTFYEVLDVPMDADAAQIRAAYRRAARANHPDTQGEASAGRMAAVNQAWQVLQDPARRREYDRSLGGTGRASRPDEPSYADPVPPFVEPRHNPLARYQDPPRIPWRFMGVMLGLGIAVVVLGVLTAGDPVPPKVDNLLRPGDCVIIDVNGDAVERLCTEPHDGTIEELVTTGMACSAAAEPHRDRQGMGTACVLLGG